MPVYSIAELKARVTEAACAYNDKADTGERIERIALFGSYANGRETSASDVDLLVSFRSAVVSLITIAKVLAAMEEALDVPVDVVPEPLPDDSLLVIERKVPLYEGF